MFREWPMVDVVLSLATTPSNNTSKTDYDTKHCNCISNVYIDKREKRSNRSTSTITEHEIKIIPFNYSLVFLNLISLQFFRNNRETSTLRSFTNRVKTPLNILNSRAKHT